MCAASTHSSAQVKIYNVHKLVQGGVRTDSKNP